MHFKAIPGSEVQAGFYVGDTGAFIGILNPQLFIGDEGKADIAVNLALHQGFNRGVVAGRYLFIFQKVCDLLFRTHEITGVGGVNLSG